MRSFMLTTILPLLILLLNERAAAADSFDSLFVDRTLRVDYMHVGDATSEMMTLDRLYEQGPWAGSKTNLVDRVNSGRYYVKVFDVATNELIFQNGFDSYFGEYRTTSAALAGVKRAYHESILMPMPRAPVQLTIEARDRSSVLHRVFDCGVDPASTDVNREHLRGDVEVMTFLDSGDIHEKVDILFLAEGYTDAERSKFRMHVERFAGIMFEREPYRSRKGMFSIRGAFAASEESGCDEPSHGSFKRTALGASFDSLGTYRYLLVEDNRTMRDIAANAPYDAIYILVNTKRYGGGGIYNLYCTTTADNQYSSYVFLHEFGHSFAGLADEYYTSNTAYNDMYPRGVEPIEPNITALLDPARLKWRDLVSPGAPLPAQWEKAEFDKLEGAYQKRREQMQRSIAAALREGRQVDELVAAEERLALEHGRTIDAFLGKSRFASVTAAFQGAGYASEGLYRASVDCIMFSKGVKPFCKVCEAAIVRVIESYGK